MSAKIAIHSSNYQLLYAMADSLKAMGIIESALSTRMPVYDYILVYDGGRGGFMFTNHDGAASTIYNLPTDWDRAMEDISRLYKDFRVGDMVKFQHDSDLYTISAITSKHYIIKYRGDSYKYKKDDAPFRLATEQEISENGLVIGEYKVQVSPDRKQISFGCQKFNKKELDVIGRLFSDQINAEVVIKGTPITRDMFERFQKAIIY